MKNFPQEKIDPMKHCQIDNIRICTQCGSSNIILDRDTIFCNDCNKILCFEHKNSDFQLN